MPDSKNQPREPALWKRPEVRFLVLFLVILAVSFTLISLNWVNQHVIEPFTGWVAAASGVVIDLLGQDIERTGTVISSPRFAVNIENGCNGVETMIIFLAAVISFPATWKSRLTGLGVGIIAIQAINLVRVVALYLTGVYFPKFFDASHTVLWQTVVILFGVLVWIFWASRWAQQPPAPKPADAASTG